MKVYLRLAANVQVTGRNSEQNLSLSLPLPPEISACRFVCHKSKERRFVAFHHFRSFLLTHVNSSILPLSEVSYHLCAYSNKLRRPSFDPDVALSERAQRVEGDVTLRL